MGNTFVVAVDGSEYAREALRHAVRWAKALGAELVLVNVQPDYDTPNIRRFVSEKLISDYQQEMADRVLKPAVNLVQAEDPSIPLHRRHARRFAGRGDLQRSQGARRHGDHRWEAAAWGRSAGRFWAASATPCSTTRPVP